MPKCSMCKREVEDIEGIQLMDDEQARRGRGRFVCWECWYSIFVDQPIVEDETTKMIETPQLRAMRKAARSWAR